MSTTTTQPVPVGSLWAFPCAEGCSSTYARVESVKGGSVHTKFFIVENGRTYPSRQRFDAKTFARSVANGTLTPAPGEQLRSAP